MSDSLLTLLAQPQEYDPYAPLAKMAQIGQANTTTQGLQIQNQGAGLSLQLQQAQAAPYLAALAANGQGGQGGTSQSPLSAFANSGGGGSAGGGAVASGSGGLAAMAAPGAGGVSWGDMGQARFGVPMPMAEQISILQSKDQAAAVASIATTRQNTLYQYAASATPETWDSHVTSLLQQGWLSTSQASQLIGHPELQPRVLQSLSSPDAGSTATTTRLGMGLTTDANGNPVVSQAAIGAKGAITGAEQDATNRSKLTYQPSIDQAENGPLVDRAVLTAKGTLGTDVSKLQAAPQKLGPNETLFVPPNPGQANAAGAAPTPINTSAAAPTALASISNPNVRNMATNAALQAGLPPEAWSSWISAVHNESGWNLTQPDGAAGEIGPGQVKPGTGAMFGYTPQQLRVPQTNLLASAQYFKQQWAAANGDPAGALRGYNGGNPGVMAAQGYANKAIQRAQGWSGGAPTATPAAAPAQAAVSNPAAPISHADERFPLPAAPDAGGMPPPNATNEFPGVPPAPSLPPGQGYAPPGASATASAPARAPQSKRASTVSPPTGVPDHPNAMPGSYDPARVVAVDDLTQAAGLPSGTPMRLPDGSVTIKGATGAQPAGTPGAFAAAGSLNPAGAPGTPTAAAPLPAPPAPAPSPAPSLAAAPSPAPAASTAPVVTQLPGGGYSVQSGISPTALAQQKAQVEADVGAMTTYRNGLLTAAQGAAQTNSLLDGMRVEAQQYQEGGGLNEDWRDMQQSLNNVSTFFGGKPIPDVANWEAFNKAAGQLVREAASTVSPRVGVQELQMVQKSLISDNTSAAGFQKIADQLQGIADYKIAKSAAASNAGQGNPNSFEGSWNAQVTPLAFMVNRMPTADAQALAVQLNKTEQGKRVLSGIMAQMHYADQAGLFRLVQP